MRCHARVARRAQRAQIRAKLPTVQKRATIVQATIAAAPLEAVRPSPGLLAVAIRIARHCTFDRGGQPLPGVTGRMLGAVPLQRRLAASGAALATQIGLDLIERSRRPTTIPLPKLMAELRPVPILVWPRTTEW